MTGELNANDTFMVQQKQNPVGRATLSLHCSSLVFTLSSCWEKQMLANSVSLCTPLTVSAQFLIFSLSLDSMK